MIEKVDIVYYLNLIELVRRWFDLEEGDVIVFMGNVKIG